MGRTSKKTPRKIDALRAGLAAGKSKRAVARDAGIPVATAARWIAELPEQRAMARAARAVAGVRKDVTPNGSESGRREPTWDQALAPRPGRPTRAVDEAALCAVLGALDEANAFFDELEEAEAAGRLCASCPGRAEGP